jgi:hypothetical protein
MDRNQATEIQSHALDACDAVHRISDLVASLSETDRSRLAPHIGAAYEALEFGLLREVYDLHPDLRPADREEPHISSTLHWRDVSLPASVSEADLDALIFSVLTRAWQKTAMVIGKAHSVSEGTTFPISSEVLGARIQLLADEERLDRRGNLAMWRHSEVRLKQG